MNTAFTSRRMVRTPGLGAPFFGIDPERLYYEYVYGQQFITSLVNELPALEASLKRAIQIRDQGRDWIDTVAIPAEIMTTTEAQNFRNAVEGLDAAVTDSLSAYSVAVADVRQTILDAEAAGDLPVGTWANAEARTRAGLGLIPLLLGVLAVALTLAVIAVVASKAAGSSLGDWVDFRDKDITLSTKRRIVEQGMEDTLAKLSALNASRVQQGLAPIIVPGLNMTDQQQSALDRFGNNVASGASVIVIGALAIGALFLLNKAK